MGLLVDDLLLLAKLDQRRPIERRPLDLVELVGDLVTDHRLLHAEWPITSESDGACRVVGDRLRLGQAVANLLGNVRQHTPPGTHVRVSVHRRGDECVVEVADDGPGIPQEHLDQVFERFHRVDPSRARARGGSGLGLSIVDAIAEAHGGRAEVESSPAGGATFRIVLPAGAS
jgi:two-component system OmpR family sensor kinase